MTLKTLNDFEDRDCYIYFDKEEKVRCIQEREIKQEAIKWVKETQDYQKLCKMFPDIKEKLESQRMNDGARAWITHFFNITEEDLK